MLRLIVRGDNFFVMRHGDEIFSCGIDITPDDVQEMLTSISGRNIPIQYLDENEEEE